MNEHTIISFSTEAAEKAAPPSFVKKPEPVTVKEFEPVKLTAEISG